MSLKEIKRDYNSLIKLWKEITSKTIKSNAPCLIHEEDNLIKRCLGFEMNVFVYDPFVSKEIVEKLEMNNISEAYENDYEFRPWGKFENLLDSKECKVKKLFINPQKRLSLQYHKYRSEHWLIVSGKAKVYIDKQTLFLNAGESVDIPQGSKHYIENLDKSPLIIIETQLGSYFGEDDIIRLDDPYERN